MNLATLLPADQVLCGPETGSKKRSLELLSELLAKSIPKIPQEDIFKGLLQRERLGSTALGKGVAIPHTRLANITSPTMAMIKLDKGIEYDAPDGQPVDILFALAVPEDSDSNHLKILASLAEMLANHEFVNELRSNYNCNALYELLSNWRPHRAA